MRTKIKSQHFLFLARKKLIQKSMVKVLDLTLPLRCRHFPDRINIVFFDLLYSLAI